MMVCLISSLALNPSAKADELEAFIQRVGLPLLIEDHYLPGPRLEPIPRTDREIPLMVRLVETKPAQDGFRYTFEVQGLDPGTYNLGNYLRKEESESGRSRHNIPLTITTELPPGLARPAELQTETLPRIGGYRALIAVLVIAWVGGIVCIYYSMRKKPERTILRTGELTIPDRLKPLLEKAARYPLVLEEQALLERLILAHWRERVPEVKKLPPDKALTALRKHSEAAPHLLQLEKWLHSRNPGINSEKLEELLKPYRS
jgi:hypothetical protein